MYSRYSSFSFKEDDRQNVVDFWINVGAPFICDKQGFRGNYIALSEDNPGKLKAITIWDSKEDFERTFLSEGHDNLLKALKETGMTIDDRDGLNVLIDSRKSTGSLRVIKLQLKPNKTEDAVNYWKSTGEQLINSQPGCMRAEAFKEPETDYLVISILWASTSDAKRFTDSEEHRKFASGMDENVLEIIEKQSLEKV
jgi:heme-degrading monooxygenase HmoA